MAEKVLWIHKLIYFWRETISHIEDFLGGMVWYGMEWESKNWLVNFL